MTPVRKLLCKDGVVQPGCEEEFKALCLVEGEKLRLIHERMVAEDPEDFPEELLNQLPPRAYSWEEEGRLSLIAAAGRLGNGEIWD